MGRRNKGASRKPSRPGQQALFGLEQHQVRWLRPAEDFELGVVLVPQLLSIEMIQPLLAASSHPLARPCGHDRDAALAFDHRVHRIEGALEETAPEIKARVLACCEAVDRAYWRRLPQDGREARHLHPEIELIDYVHKPGRPAPHIEPHVDNSSVITLVCMLRDPARGDFAGGANVFEAGESKLTREAREAAGEAPPEPRSVQLGLGDAALFRGELCEHWIEPVTAGQRTILQIELCRKREGRH